MTSFSEVEYSRIRPQPVQVRLQVCRGSSCRTVANFSTPRSFLLMMYFAIFAVRGRGNLMGPELEASTAPLSMFLEDLPDRAQEKCAVGMPILSRIRAIFTWVLTRF